MYPFYCLVEVAGNREGSEMADRLYDLLGAAEDLIVVSSLFRNLIILFRMVWLHKTRIKPDRFGKSAKRSHLPISKRAM